MKNTPHLVTRQIPLCASYYVLSSPNVDAPLSLDESRHQQLRRQREFQLH